MRSHLFSLLARTVTRRPLGVLALGLVAFLVAGAVVPRLRLKASRFDLVPPGEPSVDAYRRFDSEFGSLNAIFVVLEGDQLACRSFANGAAALVSSDRGLVSSVQYRIDLDRFRKQGIQLLDPARLRSIEKDLGDLSPLVVALAEEPSCRRFVAHVAEELRDSGGPPPPVPDLIGTMRSVAGVLRRVADRVETGRVPPGEAMFPEIALDDDKDKKASLDEEGFLCSHDRRKYLLVLVPARDLENSDATVAFLGRLEGHLRATAARVPGVTYAIGGGAVGDVEEERTIERDLGRTSTLAYVLVFGLSTLAFGSLLLALAANLVLGAALVWTSAATVALVGHLNLISSVFLAILVGLGMDFAIYLLTLYGDERARGGPDGRVEDAFERAIVLGGPGMFTGAVTTAAAFLSLLLHRFVAFRELGLIAGTGVLLAWIAMMTLLPALVVLRERVWPSPAAAARRDPRELALGAGLVRLVAPGRLFVVPAAIALVAALAAARDVPFEYSLANLQASTSRSLEVERVLRDDFGLSADFNVVLCGTLENVRGVVRAARGLRSIGVIDTPTDLAVEAGRPVDPAVGRIASMARGWPTIPTTAPPVDLPALSRELKELPAALANPRRLARMSQSPELEAEVAGLETQARRLDGLLSRSPGPRTGAMVARAGSEMAREVALVARTLAGADRVKACTLETLPAEIRSRYLGKHGSIAVYVSPSGDLSREDRARAFVQESESLAGQAGVKGVAGIPIIVFTMLEMIRSGFKQAALLALVAVMIAVLADFRSLRLTVLALVPMVCGSLWMAGLLPAAGMSWNALNSLGIPVILGVGIAFGVNLLHRLRNEPEHAVAVAGTGRAIVFSASTAMAGFGSLALSAHRGLGSFGFTLALGVAATALACLTLVPALYRRGPHAGPDRCGADGASPASGTEPPTAP